MTTEREDTIFARISDLFLRVILDSDDMQTAVKSEMDTFGKQM
jgi:hypothetical protein